MGENKNKIIDIDDSIVVKMPHMVSFNDSLIVIQMFQNMRSAACNGGSITFADGAEDYVDAAYRILSEYARAVAVAENEGGSEAIPDEKITWNTDFPEVKTVLLSNENSQHDDRSALHEIFGDAVDSVATTQDFLDSMNENLRFGHPDDIMYDLRKKSAFAINDDRKSKLMKYIRNNENITAYLVIIVNKAEVFNNPDVKMGKDFAYWAGGDGDPELAACVFTCNHATSIEDKEDGSISALFEFDVVDNYGYDVFNKNIKSAYFMLCNVERDGDSWCKVSNKILRIMKIDNPVCGNETKICYNID